MTYDGYATGEEIGWGDESTVFVARPPAGGSSTPLAIKVHGYLHDQEGVAMLEAVRQQEKAVAAGCTHIAPIITGGMAQHACFYVTERYARSLLTLIQGKVTVRPEGLRVLSRHVLQALHSLREKMDRGHGNLKASNVLLTGTARLRDSSFFLTDLCAEPTRNFAADVHAIGRIIFELVRRREVHSFDWPLAASAEWQALGPEGEAWRKFCNVLLDPGLANAADPIGVAEKALADLSHSQIATVNWGRTIGTTAAIVAVVGALGGGWMFWEHHKNAAGAPSVASAPTGENGWVGKLAEELNADPKAQSDDSYVETHFLAPLRKLHLKPAEIAALEKGQPLPGGDPQGIAATASEITAAFDAWPAHAVVTQGYDDFTAQGWTAPAASIARLRAATPNASQPVLPQLGAIAQASALVPEVQQKWRLLQEGFPKLEKAGDPVLAKTPEYLKSDAAATPDLSILRQRLIQDGEKMQSWLDLLATADHTRLDTEGKFAGFKGDVTAQTLQDWETDVRRFQPAPAEAQRLKTAWTVRLDDLTTKIRQSGANKDQLTAKVNRVRSEADTATRGLLAGDAERIERTISGEITSLENELAPAAVPAVSTASMTPPVATASVPPPTTDLTPPPMAPGDKEIFEQLMSQARQVDLAKASAATAKAARDRLVTEVRKQTSPSFQKSIAAYLTTLSTLGFRDADAPAAAPAIPSWKGPAAIPGGVAYLWGRYRMDFVALPGDGDRPPFFLGSTEVPVGLVAEWMADHPGQLDEIKSRSLPNIRGPRAWDPTPAGMVLRRDWSWPTAMGPTFTFFAPPPPDPPTAMMPMNYLSCGAALQAAKQMGFRLPTGDEWLRAFKVAKASGWTAEPNLRDAAWDAQRKHIADFVQTAGKSGVLLRDPPWPDGDVFSPSELHAARGDKAQPATGSNDHHLFFQAVNAAGKPLSDMEGNVAEFVVANDSPGAACYVAGGSALSPPEIEPGKLYEVTPVLKAKGFSDVGFRLALSPAAAAGDSRSPDVEAFSRALQNPPTASR